MISLSPFDVEVSSPAACAEVEYFMRRADREAVAAVRATDPRASDSHAELAYRYGRQLRALIAGNDGHDGVPACGNAARA